jgi:hypothetical protein
MRKTAEAARVVSTPTSKESSDSTVNSARPQSASSAPTPTPKSLGRRRKASIGGLMRHGNGAGLDTATTATEAGKTGREFCEPAGRFSRPNYHSSQTNGVNDAHGRAAFAISADPPKPTAIVAELTGVNTIVALGATTVSKTPILTLCAELVAAGIDPTMPLTVYRGSTLALTVRSIGEAANLEINGKGSGFAVRTAPLVRKNGRAGTEGGARA